MSKESKDVIPESSTGEEEVQDVTAEESSTQQEEQQEEEAVGQSSEQEEVKEENAVADDEDGRPVKNIAWEAKRKVDEIYPAIQQIQSTLQQIGQQQQQAPVEQEPQIKEEDLLWCIEDPNADPQAKYQARILLRKLEDKKQDRKMREHFAGYKKEQDGIIQRQQSMQFVSQNFPECFVRGQQGQNAGWNNNHPLTQKIGEYMMQYPQLKDNPQGLVVAAKMAAFDVGYVANKKLQKKVSQTSAQLKREQKKTLIGSGGIHPQDSSSSKSKQIQKLVLKYQETRDPEIFKQLAKVRGLIPPT